MTRIFRPVRKVAAPVGRQTTLSGQTRHVAAQGRSLLSPTTFQVRRFLHRETASNSDPISTNDTYR